MQLYTTLLKKWQKIVLIIFTIYYLILPVLKCNILVHHVRVNVQLIFQRAQTRISLPIGTSGKLLAAIGKIPNVTGKLMIGKTLAANGEEISNAMIGNYVLEIYW